MHAQNGRHGNSADQRYLRGKSQDWPVHAAALDLAPDAAGLWDLLDSFEETDDLALEVEDAKEKAQKPKGEDACTEADFDKPNAPSDEFSAISVEMEV
jgi:hypothetical protein